MSFPLMRNNLERVDLDEVISLLKEDDPRLTNGPKVRKFEEAWSKWLGVKYSVFVNSGASANLLSLAILKIRFPQGGEVIVPPLTWISDISSVIQNGFNPVFADIDPQTLGMDCNQILEKITPNTRAVFLSHIQGFNALSDVLLKELSKRKIILIEDVCESHGASHNGIKVGNYGLISNFSFYYAHHMTTIEGGMICTNDYDVYQQLRMLRSHGMVREADSIELKQHYVETYPELNPEFIFSYPSYNVRNTEIGAVMGLSQLKRLDQNCSSRTSNLLSFLSQINEERFRKNFRTDGSSNYAFNLILQEPDDNFVQRLISVMKKNNIEYRRGSAGGGNQLRQPYLKDYFPDRYYLNFPETEHIHFYGFYIGNFPDVSAQEISWLTKILNSA